MEGLLGVIAGRNKRQGLALGEVNSPGQPQGLEAHFSGRAGLFDVQELAQAGEIDEAAITDLGAADTASGDMRPQCGQAQAGNLGGRLHGHGDGFNVSRHGCCSVVREHPPQ